ncbi:VOC family protein [Microbacterium sp.]|uniref:VOC family protein n=1 Tax=Microbacterium sp. TaxID=51671 RepID=UPI003C712BBC
MSVPTLLDHIVIAGPDLDDLIAWFAERTGVVAAPGGAHPTGTANALVALTIDGERGPQYIELIGPNPRRSEPELPTTFDIRALKAPRVQAYAVHPADIESTVAAARARGFDPGDVSDLSRRTPDGTLLEWRLTRGEDRRLDVPFLIDWGSTAQPGLGNIPVIELVSFVRVEPDPAPLREVLDAYGLGDGAAEVVEGSAGEEAGFRLTLRTAAGDLVELSA